MNKTLRDEIRQKRPFQSLEQEAFLSLVRTTALLSDQFERTLKAAGVTFAQYNVLRILRGAEPEGLCRNEIRDRMLTRMPDMTRLLDRMEEAGLVSRSRDDDDRRMVRTHVTVEGRLLLDDVADQVADEHRRRLGCLGAERLQVLVEILGEVRRAAV
jgi:DNA-binding MarR family transcriptional regulator